MPLLHSNFINDHTIMGLWRLEEPLEDLLQALPPQASVDKRLAEVHPKRQREWLASRVLTYNLLAKLTTLPLQLLRNELGKPYFSDSRFHVSISHSPAMAAVILSDTYEVGIDIELISPKALRVQEKFLTDQEQTYTLADERETCLYWSAKETLYKMYSRKRLIFKENLAVEPLDKANVLQGRVQTENFSKLYRIHHETLYGHVLTYCIDQELAEI